jgi:hypothetical protein
MAKLVFGAFALFILHALLARVGSSEAALWLTGGIGCFVLVCYGLARVDRI